MVKVKSKTHNLGVGKDRNINVKILNKQIHFQNAYHLITLGNDVLTGVFFVAGSLSLLLQFPQLISNVLYFVGSFFMLMRPIINIRRGVGIFDRENEEADKFADDNIEDFPENNIEDLEASEKQPFLYIDEIEENTVQFEDIPENQLKEQEEDDEEDNDYVGY